MSLGFQSLSSLNFIRLLSQQLKLLRNCDEYFHSDLHSTLQFKQMKFLIIFFYHVYCNWGILGQGMQYRKYNVYHQLELILPSERGRGRFCGWLLLRNVGGWNCWPQNQVGRTPKSLPCNPATSPGCPPKPSPWHPSHWTGRTVENLHVLCK